MFRKLYRSMIRIVVIFLVLVLLAGIGLYFYIQPSETIGFAEPVQVPLSNRIQEVLNNRAIKITISEEEMNGYAGEEIQRLLAANKDMEQLNITGMHIELEADRAIVRTQVEQRWGIRAEVHIDMNVRWEQEHQRIKLVPTDIHIKDIPLPIRWFSIPEEGWTFSLQPLLPKWVYIKSLTMQDGGWLIHFGFRLL